MVEVKVVGNEDIVETRAKNGADLCVNEGQKLSDYRVSLAEEERRSRFFDRVHVVQ